jgi:hypothetical protein
MIAAGILCLWVGAAPPGEVDGAVVPQARVRVTLRSETTVVGTLFDSSDQVLLVRTRWRHRTIPRESVVRLETSARRSRKGKGALVGVLVGVGFGIACAADDDPWLGTRTQWFAMCTAFYGSLAAGLGAAIAPGERWDPAPLPAPYNHRRTALRIGFRVPLGR